MCEREKICWFFFLYCPPYTHTHTHTRTAPSLLAEMAAGAGAAVEAAAVARGAARPRAPRSLQVQGAAAGAAERPAMPEA